MGGFPHGSVVRIHLSVQETRIWFLIREDPNTVEQLSSWATTIEPCSRAHMLQLLKPSLPGAPAPQEKPSQWEALALQLESSPCSPQVRKSLSSNKDATQPEIHTILKRVQGEGDAQGFRTIQSLVSLNSKREPTIMPLLLGCVQVWVRSLWT